MTVARISLMKILPHNRNEVTRLHASLEEFLSKQKGYILGFSFEAIGDTETMGRVSLWASEEDANHAATLDHTVGLRSQIHILTEPGHIEQLVHVSPTAHNIPKPLR